MKFVNPFKRKVQLPVVKSVDQIVGQLSQTIKDLEETKNHHENLAQTKGKQIDTLRVQIEGHNGHAERAGKVAGNIKALIEA